MNTGREWLLPGVSRPWPVLWPIATYETRENKPAGKIEHPYARSKSLYNYEILKTEVVHTRIRFNLRNRSKGDRPGCLSVLARGHVLAYCALGSLTRRPQPRRNGVQQ